MDTFHLVLVWAGYVLGVAAVCWGIITLSTVPSLDELASELGGSGEDDDHYKASVLSFFAANVGSRYILGGIVIALLSAILHRTIT